MNNMKKKICISIDKMLLRRIDSNRGLIKRSTYIEHKLRKKT